MIETGHTGCILNFNQPHSTVYWYLFPLLVSIENSKAKDRRNKHVKLTKSSYESFLPYKVFMCHQSQTEERPKHQQTHLPILAILQNPGGSCLLFLFLVELCCIHKTGLRIYLRLQSTASTWEEMSGILQSSQALIQYNTHPLPHCQLHLGEPTSL